MSMAGLRRQDLVRVLCTLLRLHLCPLLAGAVTDPSRGQSSVAWSIGLRQCAPKIVFRDLGGPTGSPRESDPTRVDSVRTARDTVLESADGVVCTPLEFTDNMSNTVLHVPLRSSSAGSTIPGGTVYVVTLTLRFGTKSCYRNKIKTRQIPLPPP